MLKIIENHTNLSNEAVGKLVDIFIEENKNHQERLEANLFELTFERDGKFYVVYATYNNDKFVDKLVFKIHRVYE